MRETIPQVDLFINHIRSIHNKEILLTIYGVFRHWGHPFIDYIGGLKKLHENTTMPKDIDKAYTDALASDMAYIVLRHQYNQKRKWFVDESKLSVHHRLYTHVKENTWPTPKEIQDFGDKFHTLPITPCWDIPDVIDPTQLYADKSHSITRSEFIKFVRENPGQPIPQRKVLTTYLNTKETDWSEFLKEVDRNGLADEDLMIALKNKEREIKIMGRFFALMSWKFREYICSTEYLIKLYVIPLFHGLTMADNQTTVLRKMLHCIGGQGSDGYEKITIANHIDYSKWNNHQRYESTAPVFTVLGKFFGLPNLFARTHEFIERCWYYYADRPDLFTVDAQGNLINTTDALVSWMGQAGGINGLRQKGWSVNNLLVINREAKICNTDIQILAQGDNQVICTNYKLEDTHDPNLLGDKIAEVLNNNNLIINRIKKATAKIGLIINDDETLQSADMQIYGKNIMFRGNVTCLEEKRLSRVCCVTNIKKRHMEI